MARRNAQRIGIWIIAIAMTVGTLAGFVAIILQPQNEASDQAKLQELTTQYQTEQTEYQQKVEAQAAALNAQYFETFNAYASRPAVFNKDDVTDLKSEDLKIGDGATLTNESTFSAYYIGWNPSGEVFDSSIDDAALKAPITAAPGGVIEGWTEGVAGMKVGGVRELTIPSEMAYGETGSGEKIPANTPLKFVIMVIPTPETIPQPEIPAALLKYYTRGSF